ncbi:hypothetical protein B9Q20_04870 [Enterobacter mori]|nr:hypothetical protein B9Q20_04870 [Enterobacter mori]
MSMVQLERHSIRVSKATVKRCKMARCTKMHFPIVAVGICPDWADVAVAFGTVMFFCNDFPPSDLQEQRTMLTADKIIIIAGCNIIAGRFSIPFSCSVRLFLATS